MTAESNALETSDDAVLGGRLRLRQPLSGHRVGHDAILLAAATVAHAGEHAVEFGAGVGAAGLALAQRVPGLDVTLIEVDAALAALAAGNAQRNGLEARVKVLKLDVGDADALVAAGLAPGSADCVLMNPPFNDPTRQNLSPDARRRLAHAGGLATLSRWVDAAALLLKANGMLTLIWRADGLADVLKGLAGAFGGIAVMPIYPRPDAAAIRVLVRAGKGSRAPLALLPALTLNDSQGQTTAAAEAVLRGGATL